VGGSSGFGARSKRKAGNEKKGKGNRKWKKKVFCGKFSYMYTEVTVTKKEYINQLFDHSVASIIDFSKAVTLSKLPELRLSSSKTFWLALLSLSSSLTYCALLSVIFSLIYSSLSWPMNSSRIGSAR
jgi:hypothetical protein